MHSPSTNSGTLPPIHIIGRYPPPIDGQSLATESLADLLEPSYHVNRLNMTLAERALLPTGFSGISRAISHYLDQKPKLREQFSDGHPILWTNISCQPSGHWRDLLSVIPCVQPRQPLIAVVHWGNFSRLFTNWITTVTARQLIKRLDFVVVLSQELANQIKDWIPPDKLQVIPNYVPSVSTEDERSSKRHEFSSSKTLRVLFLSHMVKEKGCYDLLNGIAIGVKNGLSIEAHFAGRWNHPSDETRFHHEIQQLGLQKNVRIHGPITDRETVAKLHQMAHIFVLPSVLQHEAQPLAILEALSAATPVIITKRPAFEALVNASQGAHLVPPHNPDAIAQALQSLRDETTWLKHSLAAHQRYETAYSPDTVRQKWVNLIASL